MKQGICGLILALCLTGCAGARSEEGRALTAPDVVVYSRAQLSQAADELERCKCPQLEDMMKDYCVARDQSRLLQGKKTVCTKKPLTLSVKQP